MKVNLTVLVKLQVMANVLRMMVAYMKGNGKVESRMASGNGPTLG
jgi:hypothetical protein